MIVAGEEREEEDEYETPEVSSSRIGICVNKSSSSNSSSSSSGEGNGEMEDTASSPGEVKVTEVGEGSKAVTNAQLPATSTPGVEERRNTDSPPTDDCCPICFGTFVVPCKAPCGHWYCGGCILQYWNYGAALQPCNCPMCTRKITSLTPQASLGQRQEDDTTEILKNIRRYNRLFVGGRYGLFLRLLELPLYMKRMFHDMMNPDRPGAHLNKLRIFAMILGLLYTFSPLDFLRIGQQNVIDVFDYSAMALSLVLYVFGLYHRRRRLQRVREMAAVQL